MKDENSISRRKFLGTTAAGIVGTAAASGEAAAARSIGDPVFTTDYIYIREQPDANSPLIRTCNAYTGLEIDDGPWYADGWKWWKYYVNGDENTPGRVRGYGVESYTTPANFAYPAWGEIVSSYNDDREFLGRKHQSIDIANDYGTRVRASLGGTVTWAGWGDSYGYWIEIDHGNGWTTRYAHLQSLYVTEGDYVGRDQQIGEMGCTGDCWSKSNGGYGPHVHFEIQKDGVRQNWDMDEGTHVWWGSGIERSFW